MEMSWTYTENRDEKCYFRISDLLKGTFSWNKRKITAHEGQLPVGRRGK
jgi:hypothetical protein